MTCESCEQDLGGHRRWCPESPITETHKWAKCVCYVHTCWDEKARRRAQ